MEVIQSSAMIILGCFLTWIAATQFERKQSNKDMMRIETAMERGFKSQTDAIVELSGKIEAQGKEIEEVKLVLVKDYVTSDAYQKHKDKCDQTFRELGRFR